MRLIAEAILPPSRHGKTYVQGELVNRAPTLTLPTDASFHLYCSPNNPGAVALLWEVAAAHKLRFGLGKAGLADLGLAEATGEEASLPARGEKRSSVSRLRAARSPLLATTDKDDLPRCQQFLLYLTAETWTGGERSAALAREVESAMKAGLPLLLAHEMPGVGGQEARHAAEFASFFACDDGATPPELLQAGIYSKIAIALTGSSWREASMVLLLQGVQSGNDKLEEASLSSLSSHSSRKLSWVRQAATPRDSRGRPSRGRVMKVVATTRIAKRGSKASGEASHQSARDEPSHQEPSGHERALRQAAVQSTSADASEVV